MLDAYDKKHYCALDWHVISILIVEGSVAGQKLTNSEIFDQIAGREVVFTLDGAPLATERTTPRRVTNPQFRGYDEAFYVQVGRVMAPTELAVGTHTLEATGNLFGQPPEDFGTITFFVDHRMAVFVWLRTDRIFAFAASRIAPLHGNRTLSGSGGGPIFGPTQANALCKGSALLSRSGRFGASLGKPHAFLPEGA